MCEDRNKEVQALEAAFNYLDSENARNQKRFIYALVAKYFEEGRFYPSGRPIGIPTVQARNYRELYEKIAEEINSVAHRRETSGEPSIHLRDVEHVFLNLFAME